MQASDVPPPGTGLVSLHSGSFGVPMVELPGLPGVVLWSWTMR